MTTTELFRSKALVNYVVTTEKLNYQPLQMAVQEGRARSKSMRTEKFH